MSWRAVVRCTRAGLIAPGSISDGLRAAIKAAPRRHRRLLQRKLGDLSTANPDDELARHQSEFNELLVAEPIPDDVGALYIGLTESAAEDAMSTTLRFHIAGAKRCDDEASPPVRAADLVWPRQRRLSRLALFERIRPTEFVLPNDPNFGADDPPANLEPDEPYEDWASPLQIFATVAAGRLLTHLLAAAPRVQTIGPRPKRTLIAGFDAGELFVYADLTPQGVSHRPIHRRIWLR